LTSLGRSVSTGTPSPSASTPPGPARKTAAAT